MATRRMNFHEQLVEELGRSIVSGANAPGGRLRTEDELAQSLGVGRLALREAMKALAAKGMVEIRPRTGTVVTPKTNWNPFDPQVLQWQFQGDRDNAVLEDLLELRRMVEPTAAMLAARRASDAEVRAAREAYEAMCRAAAGDGSYMEEDLAFHQAILTGCGNQFVRQMSQAIGQLLHVSFEASTFADDDHFGLALHEDLLLRIEQRNPSGAHAAALRLIDFAAGKLARKGWIRPPTG